jgi:hypothetical protein
MLVVCVDPTIPHTSKKEEKTFQKIIPEIRIYGIPEPYLFQSIFEISGFAALSHCTLVDISAFGVGDAQNIQSRKGVLVSNCILEDMNKTRSLPGPANLSYEGDVYSDDTSTTPLSHSVLPEVFSLVYHQQ